MAVTLYRRTKHLANSAMLISMYIPPQKVVAVWTRDLKEFYFDFVASRARALRNAFAGEWSRGELTELLPGVALDGPGPFVCALDTLAMGDCNAVEFGQGSNLAVALRSGSMLPDEVAVYGEPLPRKDLITAVIVDDAAWLELEPSGGPGPGGAERSLSLHPPAGSRSGARVKRYERECAERGLRVHDAKGCDRAGATTLWGADFDGILGTLRPAVPRAIVVSALCLRIAALGFATVHLLEVVQGCLIAALAPRRRCYCLLDLLVNAQRGRKRSDILRLSWRLRQELSILSLFVCVSFANLRAETLASISVVDASLWGIAGASAAIPAGVAQELRRHTLHRGRWTRLLTGARKWYRMHGLLDENDELPDEQRFQTSPLWISLLESLRFIENFRHAYPSRAPHINIGEVRAHLREEARVANEARSVHVIIGGDSQVATGSLVRGRSSSPAINAELQAGLPVLLGGDLYAEPFWTPSPTNPADHPTRGRSIPPPVAQLPPWWAAGLAGDWGPLDAQICAEQAQAGRRVGPHC